MNKRKGAITMRQTENNWQDGRFQHKTLIITFSENGVNTWVKRQRLTVWMDKRARANYMLSTRNTL